ncbi:hypothetical protein [Nocardia thraciensis]
MQRRKLALVASMLAMLCATPAQVGAAPVAPASPGALADGVPWQFRFIQRGDPAHPACIYYNETAAGRGDAVDESTCRSDTPHVFTKITMPDTYLRFQLTDHPDKCLIGDTSTSPGVVIVGSCDDSRADWGGFGTQEPPDWVLYPRSAPNMYLRDNGIALVLQNTEHPLTTPGYYWRLM